MIVCGWVKLSEDVLARHPTLARGHRLGFQFNTTLQLVVSLEKE